MRFGSEELKQRFLPPVAEGKMLSGGSFTEPNHGSDITSMDTTAVRQGDEWLINGTKTFITNGGIADYLQHALPDRLGGAAHLPRASLILVEGDRPGLDPAEVGDKMGIRMMSTAEVSYKDVQVPVDNLIGQEGQGFYQVLEFFDESRVEIAARRSASRRARSIARSTTSSSASSSASASPISR